MYFDEGKQYLAAWEFEYAQRLMPERPEPVNNLGLVYESIGQFQKAIPYYQQAVDLAPNSANFLGNLIRCRIRAGEDPLFLKEQIERLALIDSRLEWTDWARSQLLLRNQVDRNENESQMLSMPESPPFEPSALEEFETFEEESPDLREFEEPSVLEDFDESPALNEFEQVLPAEPLPPELEYDSRILQPLDILDEG